MIIFTEKALKRNGVSIFLLFATLFGHLQSTSTLSLLGIHFV